MQAPRAFTPVANTPLCLEIGAGKGKHAMLFTEQHPERHLVAIERTKEKFLAMQKQQELHARAHLTPVHADALPWIVHALYPAQVEQAFILYPNPEPHNPKTAAKYAVLRVFTVTHTARRHAYTGQ